ncbi:acylphosphatase [Pararobbsia silviterrae]|uniref:acylphosphatase n=1 Tax=Pararobbsia silviterrae TaxID=1792498 RepID=A0A494XRX6_9BURK|nr:acylphosphatase [Pararobbsia silviterrae]RKP53355.1 acylphosphatase [Pararobbsia silviterrae]
MVSHAKEQIETYHVHVRGRVQGVGYRFSTVRRAHELGIGGWVQNREDGTVEAVIQGPPDQVDRMLEFMRKGPPAARVTELESERSYAERKYDRFEQR